jgi:hypothetical protein
MQAVTKVEATTLMKLTTTDCPFLSTADVKFLSVNAGSKLSLFQPENC